jgi:putative DNA primase/helicase
MQKVRPLPALLSSLWPAVASTSAGRNQPNPFPVGQWMDLPRTVTRDGLPPVSIVRALRADPNSSLVQGPLPGPCPTTPLPEEETPMRKTRNPKDGHQAKPSKARTAAVAKTPPALPEDHGDGQEDQVACVAASELKQQRLSWLLPGMFPLGAVAVLEGRKEAGKSSLAACVAAAVTGGPSLPGCRKRPAAAAVWFAGEEHFPSATLPKLRAAGAELSHVYCPGYDARGRLTRPWLFPGDLPRLEHLLRAHGARLAVFDPLSSFVAPGLNLCSEQDARSLLDPLGRLAADCSCLFLILRHLRKGLGGHLHDAGLGSIAIGAAARAVIRVDVLDQPVGRRVLRAVACNLGPPALPLLFDLEAADGAARLVWRGTADIDDPRFADEVPDPAERDALGDASRYLLDALKAGPVPAKELVRRAQEIGVTLATLRRAKRQLSIHSRARGNLSERVWYWQIPKS